MQVGPGVHESMDPAVREQVRQTLWALQHHDVPFMVGGSFALGKHAGIIRSTKDLDLFFLRGHVHDALNALSSAGAQTDMTDIRWLAKAKLGDVAVDLVFDSANQLCPVDEEWFQYASCDVIVNVPVMLCPVEEIVWQKSFIQERERYDGADVQHLLRTGVQKIDWDRLLRRFAGHGAVLLSQLILFDYIYPYESRGIPAWVRESLVRESTRYDGASFDLKKTCRGPLLSQQQYQIDIERWAYDDPRQRMPRKNSDG